MKNSNVSSPSPLYRKAHEHLHSSRGSQTRPPGLITLQRAYTDSPEPQKFTFDNVLEENLEKTDDELLTEQVERDFLLAEQADKLKRFSKGLQIVQRLMGKPSSNPVADAGLRSFMTINLSTELGPDNENPEESGSKVKSESEIEEEEKKPHNVFSPRKIRSSINLNFEGKASLFRKTKQLSINTVISHNLKSLAAINPGITRRTFTILNDSGLSAAEKQRNKKDLLKVFKKSSSKVSTLNKFKKRLGDPPPFLGSGFVEKEVNSVRHYHKPELEINNPALIREKSLMGKAFTNDLLVNQKTFFSKRLREKMERQALMLEGEGGSEEGKKGWLRCDLGPINSCKCDVF